MKRVSLYLKKCSSRDRSRNPSPIPAIYINRNMVSKGYKQVFLSGIVQSNLRELHSFTREKYQEWRKTHAGRIVCQKCMSSCTWCKSIEENRGLISSSFSPPFQPFVAEDKEEKCEVPNKTAKLRVFRKEEALSK